MAIKGAQKRWLKGKVALIIGVAESVSREVETMGKSLPLHADVTKALELQDSSVCISDKTLEAFSLAFINRCYHNQESEG